MQFAREDNDNCRVYYREEGRLYCWQNDGTGSRNDWNFYRCSSDGEPSHPVKAPAVMPYPPGYTVTGRDLRDRLSTVNA